VAPTALKQRDPDRVDSAVAFLDPFVDPILDRPLDICDTALDFVVYLIG